MNKNDQLNSGLPEDFFSKLNQKELNEYYELTKTMLEEMNLNPDDKIPTNLSRNILLIHNALDKYYSLESLLIECNAALGIEG